MSSIRVFIVDDHEITRRGIRDLFDETDDLHTVGEAANAAEAMRRVGALRPDVALLDTRLPDTSGIEVCRLIRSSFPAVACLVLTSYDDDEALFAAIMAGAAGYVLKQVRGTDLRHAVRAVAAGGSLLDPVVTTRVLQRLRDGPSEDQRLAALGPRERQVLRLITDGLTNREIAAAVHLSEKTVKNYVSRVLDKLELASRTQAAVYSLRCGDRWPQSDQR